jgi:hypothetical protein
VLVFGSSLATRFDSWVARNSEVRTTSHNGWFILSTRCKVSVGSMSPALSWCLLVLGASILLSPVWSADFVGPVVVQCPLRDLAAQPCVADPSGLQSCSDITPCQDAYSVVAPIPDESYYYFALQCACLVANNCPDSCAVYQGGSAPTDAAAPVAAPTLQLSPSSAGATPGSSVGAPVAGPGAAKPTSRAVWVSVIGPVLFHSAVLATLLML